MNLSISLIPSLFPHVFNNEFNERKILSYFIDNSWGSYVMMSYVTSSKASFDLNCYGNRGREIYNLKCNTYKNLKRTLVLTEDMNGNIQLFQFFLDFKNDQLSYCEINMSTQLSNEFYDSCNVLKKYYV